MLCFFESLSNLHSQANSDNMSRNEKAAVPEHWEEHSAPLMEK